MPREINAAGYKLIKEFEAGPQGNSRPALTPYYCPAGKLTNGWGNTHGVVPGVKITLAQAEADLERNLDWAEECVDQVCPGANDNEFAAMVSLTFNIGAAKNAGFPSSTVARLFNKGDKPGAASAFALWRKMRDPKTGQLVDSVGLQRRRNVEASLFLTPAPERAPVAVAGGAIEVTKLPPPPEPMPQAVAPEPSTVSSRTVITGGVAVATGAASVADQLGQLQPTLDAIATFGASLQSIWKLGALGLSVISLVAVGVMLWRYIQKKRRGEVLST